MAKPSPSNKANLALRINAVRQLHVYVSVLVAPMVLFWSITGALQVFRIPDHQPPASILAKLASVHKNSTYAPKTAPKAAPKSGAAAKPAAPAPVAPATTLLKWYFVLASVALTLSTLLGAWMGIAYHRRKRLMWALLGLGSAIPIALLVAAG